MKVVLIYFYNFKQQKDRWNQKLKTYRIGYVDGGLFIKFLYGDQIYSKIHMPAINYLTNLKINARYII